MPRGREPEGQAALTNAERQARFRARRLTLRPAAAAKRPAAGARRSRTKRWNDALAELVAVQSAFRRDNSRCRNAVQAECVAWFDALPESLRDNATAAALQEMIDLDLDAIVAIQPPLGYGRD
jgi:hypothetical protein